MLTYNFANKILDHMCGKSPFSSLNQSITVGLSSTAPNRGGTGYTEPNSSTGYDRLLLGNSGQALTQLMDSAVDGVITNEKNIFFNRAIAAYASPITHFLVFSSDTLIAYGELTTPITVGINTVPLIEIGELTITIDEAV